MYDQSVAAEPEGAIPMGQNVEVNLNLRNLGDTCTTNCDDPCLSAVVP
jgi:hypothetical protein